MNIKDIKNKINAEVNSPNKIATVSNANIQCNVHLDITESYTNKLKCVLRHFLVFFAKYKWVKTFYVYIKK